MGVEPFGERSVRLAQAQHHAGVVDRRLDLEPVPDDAGIGHQPRLVAPGEAGDDLGIEPAVRLPEAVALLEDGEPRQPRLVDLQDEALEELGLLPAREAVLAVVVGAVEGVAGGVRAVGMGHGGDAPRAWGLGRWWMVPQKVNKDRRLEWPPLAPGPRPVVSLHARRHLS